MQGQNFQTVKRNTAETALIIDGLETKSFSIGPQPLFTIMSRHNFRSLTKRFPSCHHFAFVDLDRPFAVAPVDVAADVAAARSPSRSFPARTTCFRFQ